MLEAHGCDGRRRCETCVDERFRFGLRKMRGCSVVLLFGVFFFGFVAGLHSHVSSLCIIKW